MTRRETAGLLLAWAIHDAEEWHTLGPWSRARAATRSTTPTRLPVPPWLRHGVSDRHCHAAITAMGVLVAGATLDGLRTRGRSRFFRAAVLAYAAHGLGHLAASTALRDYTPGVATTPVAVLGYAAWALRRTRHEHGPLDSRETSLAAALLPASLGLAHTTGTLRERGSTPGRAGTR